ncbi:MAG TPA: efflux RND transporter permease subunit [Candidatus Tectomicrobia bacterium]|jgi:predicted RND superfamily exporter protein
MITRLLGKLAALCVTRPWYVIGFFAACTLGALPLVLHLPLEADLRETLPADMVQAMERRIRLFGTSDLAFLLVQTEQGSKADLLAFGAALAPQLSASALIRRVEYGYPPALLQALGDVALDYAPLFVSPEQLESFAQLLTPEGIRAQVQQTLLALSTPGAGGMERALLEDPLQLRRFLFARLAMLRGSFRFASGSPYFLSPDGTALLIRVEGQASVNDMAGVKATMGVLQQAIQEVLSRPAFRGLTVQGTGGYYLAAESERVIRGDLTQSINLTVVLICALVAWVLRRWGALWYGQLPTLLGLFLALAIFALLRPRLNALTLGCSAALVGLGDDSSIHLLTQCFARLGKGQSRREAIYTAVRETSGGLLGAAVTIMAAFAAFLFSTQHFLQDMGLLAALGILCCFLVSLTFLPALVICLPEQASPLPPRTMGMPFLTVLSLRAARLVLGVSLGLCLGAVVALLRWPPGFETDLRNIHAAHSPVLQVQTKIAAIFGGSQEPLTLMLEGATEEQVVQAMRQLTPALQAMVADGALAAVASPNVLYPSPEAQAAVLQRLRRIDPDTLAQVLAESLEAAGFDMPALQGYLARVRHVLTLRTPLNLAALETLGVGEMLHPFLSHDEAGAVGLVVLFPRRDLWTLADRHALSQRVTALLAQLRLHGTLTSLYTVSAASAARVGVDFRRITLFALGFVGLSVCLQFRRPWAIGMVLLPVACGALWTAGLFALLGLKLNFMNIAILPMLLGLGVDYGIHIVHRFRLHGGLDVQEALRFTSTAVCLGALTTMVGFGSLALSVNQGIASVGLVALTGMTACLLASLFTLPAALHIWGQQRSEDA